MMTEPEYEAALARFEVLMDVNPELESEAGEELLSLAEQLMQYERVHFPFPIPMEAQ